MSDEFKESWPKWVVRNVKDGIVALKEHPIIALGVALVLIGVGSWKVFIEIHRPSAKQQIIVITNQIVFPPNSPTPTTNLIVNPAGTNLAPKTNAAVPQ